MTIKLTGDKFEDVERYDTGIFTFDKALGDVEGNVGMPGRAVYEWYGPKSGGKTTTAIDLAAYCAMKQNAPFSLLDLEIQHKSTIMAVLENSGFDGDFNYMTMKKGESPDSLMDRFNAAMAKNGSGMAVVDSLGAYTSKAELDGKLNEPGWGTPREIGKFTGRLVYAIQTDQDNPRVIFLINHEHPAIGFMAHGNVTGGGQKKKYLSHIRCGLKNAFLGKHTIKYPTGQLVEGRVDNNRYGYSGGHFWMYIIYGRGIHRGLTAFWECIALKLAEVSAESITDATTVRLDGVKMGKIGDFITRYQEPEFVDMFKAFRAKLEANATVSLEDEQESEE